MKDNARRNTLHITIGTAMSFDTERKDLASILDTSQELRLLKAAILYADQVKFCSYAATSFLSALNRPLGMSEDEKLAWFLSFYEQLGDEYLLKEIRILGEGYRTSKHNRRKNFGEYLRYRQAFENSYRKIDKTIDKTKFAELMKAINSGIVEFKAFTSGYSAEDFMQEISAAIDSSTTYPLLDERTGSLLNTGIKGGKIKLLGTSINRAKQVGLSSELFSRLPLFDDASISEVIDIRKELDSPLKRFRAGVVGFSKEIESAPWNKEFTHEAEQIFIEYVEPTVLEIEDAYKSSKPLSDLLSRALTHSGAATTSTLGILFSLASHHPILLASISAAAGLTLGTIEELKEQRQQKREIEKNQLYFYYKAGKMLS
jgi:hypothetical protein